MLFTTPSTGIPTFLNIKAPFLASIMAISWGVVTIIAPATGMFCAMLNWVSPVPGGMSMTR